MTAPAPLRPSPTKLQSMPSDHPANFWMKYGFNTRVSHGAKPRWFDPLVGGILPQGSLKWKIKIPK